MTNDPFRAHAPIPFNFSENVVEYWKEFEQIRTPAQNGSKPEEFHFVKGFKFGVFLVRIFPYLGHKNSEYGHFLTQNQETIRR